MPPTHPPDNDQAALWNGPSGDAWVEMRPLLDKLFAPVERLIVEAVMRRSPHEVLDVGCGTGATTIAIARALDGRGEATGIDISQQMIAVAETRAEAETRRPSFICADAEAYPFAAARFDMVVSRFGVMFFGDPVAAFANLGRAAKPGADLLAVAWRSPAENPFMTTAERAAAPLLPQLARRPPDGRGQFAFADSKRVETILRESGWAEISIQPTDIACSLPEDQIIQYVTRLGPVGLALRDVDDATRTNVVRTVRAAFEPYLSGEIMHFTAACWAVAARMPSAA